jgi:hypothetical protein
LGFLTYVGVFRFKPCITGEFMGKAPKFKNRFLQGPSGAPTPKHCEMTLAKNDRRTPKSAPGGLVLNEHVPVL